MKCINFILDNGKIDHKNKQVNNILILANNNFCFSQLKLIAPVIICLEN